MPKRKRQLNMTNARRRAPNATQVTTEERATQQQAYAALHKIVSDDTTSASARVAAARTLLEASGSIGRHQAKPKTDRLSAMSLEDMLLELRQRTSADAAEDNDSDIF